MKSSENNAEAPEPKPTQNIDARLATSEDLASALTVLRGAPSPEELAAVIAVLQHAQHEQTRRKAVHQGRVEREFNRSDPAYGR